MYETISSPACYSPGECSRPMSGGWSPACQPWEDRDPDTCFYLTSFRGSPPGCSPPLGLHLTYSLRSCLPSHVRHTPSTRLTGKEFPSKPRPGTGGAGSGSPCSPQHQLLDRRAPSFCRHSVIHAPPRTTAGPPTAGLRSANSRAVENPRIT